MTPEMKAQFDAIKAKYNYTPTTPAAQANDWFAATAPKKPLSSFPAVAGAIGEKFNERADNVDKINNSTDNPVSKVVQRIGQGAGVVNDSIGEVVKSVIKPEILQGAGEKIAPIVEAAKNNPVGQGILNWWDTLKTDHPETARNLEATGNFALLLSNALVGGGAAKGAKVGVEAAEATLPKAVAPLTEKASGAINTAKDTLSSAKKAVVGTVSKDPYEAALQAVTPEYKTSSTAQRSKLIDEKVGGQPRVQEGSLIKGRVVTPNALEKEAARELSSLAGYTPKATYLDTHNLIETEILTRARALETSLKNENILVPKKEIVSTVRDAINTVPEESLLLQKSDPAIGNYIRVVENAAAKNDGTLKGVLDVRKAMDAAYKNARGKLAYNDEKLASLDEVHQAGRDSLTKYLIDHAKNTDVKAALRGQWNLYRADDVILPKAAKEAGTIIERGVEFAKEHPIVTGAGAVGTGLTVKGFLGL